MINFTKNLIIVKRLTLGRISSSKKKIKIKFILKKRIKELVLTLTNIFNSSYNLLNFVSLGFLNIVKVYHYNKNQILYNLEI